MRADGLQGITPERTQGMIRKNQKGFTIVELIIAVAILAIVTLAVCGFIVVGSKSYTSANTDIMLQQEAQLALNQMSDVIIDTTDSISYSVGDASDLQPVLKDSEYAGEATDKSLAVVNRKDDTSNNDNSSYWFYWSKDYEKIYFGEIEGIDAATTDAEIQNKFDSVFDSLDPDSAAVLAEHVTDLSIDISQFEENRVVMISMSLENGNRTYSTSNNVTVRNRIALNVVNIDPMTRRDAFTITAESVTLEPGETYTLNAAVDTTSSDTALTWELAENGSPYGTSITESGTITIGQKETRNRVEVKVSRKNPEYAGQNDRVAKTVYVYVKRVTYVHDEDITASPGDVIELNNSSVKGNNLGKDCISCPGTEDDKALINWRSSNNTLASIDSSDTQKATVKISSAAKNGDVIVIYADSERSAFNVKNYGPLDDPGTAPVTGEWRIKIEGEDKPMGDIELDSGIKFGTDNEVAVSNYGFLAKGMYGESSASELLVCARIRDTSVSSNPYDDRVVMYYTGAGKDVRFYPDMFGLDLNRSYDIFLQLIMPVPTDTIVNGNVSGIHNYDADIIKEYFKPENQDGNGKYIGTKYGYSPLFHGSLNKPTIEVYIDGIPYPNDNPDYHIKKYLLDYGPGSSILSKPTMDENGAINVRWNTVKEQLTFSFYKGEGDNPDNWEPVYVYSEEIWDYKGEVNQPVGGTTAVVINPRQDPMVKKEQSADQAKVAGTYKIVPGFYYENKKYGIDRRYNFIYPLDGSGELDLSKATYNRAYVADYSMHHYPQYEATATLELKLDDINLELPPSWGASRRSYFPLPTDKEFPFIRNNTGVQTITWSFRMYDGSGNRLSIWDSSYNLDNAMVDCQYYPASGSASEYYKITIYTESSFGADYTKTIYGVYVWKPGDVEWSTQEPGIKEDKGKAKTNIVIVQDGVRYLSYFPAPDEADYPFNGITGVIDIRKMKLYEENGSRIKFADVTTVYSGSGITMTGSEIQGHKLGTYNYGSYTFNAGKWSGPSGNISAKYEAVGVVPFKWNGVEYKIKLPLPTMDGYPFAGDNSAYASGDIYCEGGSMTWVSYSVTYKVDGNTYTATVEPSWGNKPIRTFEWIKGQDVNWRMIGESY